MSNQQQTPQRSSPFNRPSSQQSQNNPFSSRFKRPGTPTNTPSPPSPPRPLGGRLPGRFGNAVELKWSIKTMSNTLVRFSLDGLGDPFHRVLGTPINLDYGSVEAIGKALGSNQNLHDTFAEKLEEAWQAYDFSGAAFVFAWQDNTPDALTASVIIEEKADNNEETEDSDDFDDGTAAIFEPVDPPTFLRSIDPALVINVLARLRSQILVAGTPLALESGFLQRNIVSGDSRLVELARATGYIEERL